jgi:hypothetical protein
MPGAACRSPREKVSVAERDAEIGTLWQLGDNRLLCAVLGSAG